MVVTSLPATRDTGTTHDRIASPSRWTVQAPHSAMPHPYLVPVRPRFSRKTQSRGVEGSTSRFTCRRFTLKEIIGIPPLNQTLPLWKQEKILLQVESPPHIYDCGARGGTRAYLPVAFWRGP